MAGELQIRLNGKSPVRTFYSQGRTASSDKEILGC